MSQQLAATRHIFLVARSAATYDVISTFHFSRTVVRMTNLPIVINYCIIIVFVIIN